MIDINHNITETKRFPIIDTILILYCNDYQKLKLTVMDYVIESIQGSTMYTTIFLLLLNVFIALMLMA